MPTAQGQDPTRRPRRTDARLNRERLLATAREVFAEAGPEASLNEIARRAGVGPGTLYRHFPNRSALLAAVLTDRIETLYALAGTLASSESADEALTQWLRAFLAHARINQGLGSALLVEEPVPLGLDCHRLIMDAAAGLLSRAQRQGTARTDLAADDLVQLVVGIALSTARGHDAEQPDRLLALVLDATYGRPPRSR
ncbi:TetR family transcriptional regulator [Streptomyces longisporoflavus]|uniref:TetR/AcrR family transcriptional regulator n=1 Tax=Streptomyces longisporoflavus TaxID=28044 RepID=UPI00167DE332|nr:TetR/AcrR family transcriptional regulator [Streptomyces longisporoflavus]GGV27462.1 TetR family transcriptional regulator [Streptomyces longisporoflavus]